MKYTNQSAVELLLASYKTYYNITKYEDKAPLVALCEFYEKSGRYVVAKNAELWSANCEEFLFLYEVDHLTLDVWNQIRGYTYDEGMKMAHIGPGHMYTYITPVIVCNSCDEDAKRAIKRCHIYKSFHFSFHGWMDYHVAVLETGTDKLYSNRSGKCVIKGMKKILF